MNKAHELYLAQKQLKDMIKSIPKKNKQKFAKDLSLLIHEANKDDYNTKDYFKDL